MPNIIETQLDRLARDRWARRALRTLLRAAWLAAAVWCLGLGMALLLDRQPPLDWLAVGSLACLGAGALLTLRRRMSPREVARRLDRRFRLHEQISTALEVGAAGEGGGVPAYLSEEARRTLTQVRRFTISRRRSPWPEAVGILAMLLVTLALLVLLGIGGPQLPAGALPLPPLAGPDSPPPPDEPFSPPAGSQPGPGPGTLPVPGPGNQAVAEAIADALRDQGATRPAAEALDQGDPAEAASRLRELADQAGQLSEQARQDLADALREAASEIQQADPQAASELARSAEGLEQGGAAAAEALEDLAETVEGLSQPGQGSGQQPGQGGGGGSEGEGSGGAGQGLAGEQRQQPADRLNVEGVPLELEGGEDGNTPTEGQAEGDPAQGSGSGFVDGEANPGVDTVQTGEDPLRIPADMRDVVQDYFTP